MKQMLRLLALYRPYYGWMALGVLLSLLTVLANLTLMAISGWFITSMALAGAAGVSMNYFTPAALIRGSAIVRTGGRYLERLITHEATLRQLASLRSWFYQRIEPLAPAGLQMHHGGDLLSRIRADIDTLDNLYLRLLVPGITALLATLLITLYLTTYDSGLALILLSTMALAGIALPLLAMRLGRQPGERKVSLLAQQRSMLVDGTQGLAELLVYGAQAEYLDRLNANSRELATEQARLSGSAGISQAGLLLAANLALWLVLWQTIPMVEQGVLAKADLAMLALFSLAAFESVMPLPAALQAYGETRAAALRLLEIADSEVPISEPTTPTPLPQHFDIRFEQVTFRYPGGSQDALQQLDLQLDQGQRLTVQGPSGAGKSTLWQLLVHFQVPTQGTISVGGIPLEQLGGDQIRRLIAVVPQQTHLFSGTIRDNLVLGNPDADDKALADACEIAQIQGFIESLPDTYDTWIGEAGATLSGGQARRIAIARALLKDSPVLVLDEPTEGLDATSARKLLDALDEATAGKTVIMITHRQKRDQRFGLIASMHDGRMNLPA